MSLAWHGNQQTSVGRSLGDEDGPVERPAMATHQANPRVRVKLCLRAEHDHCGDYTDADSKYQSIHCFLYGIKSQIPFTELKERRNMHSICTEFWWSQM
jgi:hypothetical protein